MSAANIQLVSRWSSTLLTIYISHCALCILFAEKYKFNFFLHQFKSYFLPHSIWFQSLNSVQSLNTKHRTRDIAFLLWLKNLITWNSFCLYIVRFYCIHIILHDVTRNTLLKTTYSVGNNNRIQGLFIGMNEIFDFHEIFGGTFYYVHRLSNDAYNNQFTFCMWDQWKVRLMLSWWGNCGNPYLWFATRKRNHDCC